MLLAVVLIMLGKYYNPLLALKC